MSKLKKDRGFTLVELLVVMGIMAVLIAIAVAGLAFAMRRSRNIARSSALSNLDKALAAYYTENVDYPDEQVINELIGEGSGEGELENYLEGSWDAGPGVTEYYYKYDSGDLVYTVCVSQETFGGDTEYICMGPGIGQDEFPAEKKLTGACTNCGTCAEYDAGSDSWDSTCGS